MQAGRRWTKFALSVFGVLILFVVTLLLIGAVLEGEQLLVRFLTTVVVAALLLYILSDFRLDTAAKSDTRSSDKKRAPNHNEEESGPVMPIVGVNTSEHPTQPPANSTAAFMASVTETQQTHGDGEAGSSHSYGSPATSGSSQYSTMDPISGRHRRAPTAEQPTTLPSRPESVNSVSTNSEFTDSESTNPESTSPDSTNTGGYVNRLRPDTDEDVQEHLLSSYEARLDDSLPGDTFDDATFDDDTVSAPPMRRAVAYHADEPSTAEAPISERTTLENGQLDSSPSFLTDPDPTMSAADMPVDANGSGNAADTADLIPSANVAEESSAPEIYRPPSIDRASASQTRIIHRPPSIGIPKSNPSFDASDLGSSDLHPQGLDSSDLHRPDFETRDFDTSDLVASDPELHDSTEAVADSEESVSARPDNTMNLRVRRRYSDKEVIPLGLQAADLELIDQTSDPETLPTTMRTETPPSTISPTKPSKELDAINEAIFDGEHTIISSLIARGVLSSEGPITNDDVNTMVYVAFTSSELRKLLLAGGTVDTSDGEVELASIEIYTSDDLDDDDEYLLAVPEEAVQALEARAGF